MNVQLGVFTAAVSQSDMHGHESAATCVYSSCIMTQSDIHGHGAAARYVYSSCLTTDIHGHNLQLNVYTAAA